MILTEYVSLNYPLNHEVILTSVRNKIDDFIAIKIPFQYGYIKASVLSLNSFA